MFTGLVQAIGKVRSIEKQVSSAKLLIADADIASNVAIGDSVSVNGTCLTVTQIAQDSFSVDVMTQTLDLTSTGQLEIGSVVNLELATLASGRLGGHIVQGHVDGVGKVISLEPGEQWSRLDVEIPGHLMKYVVAQGSICIDGVSLTVGELNDALNQITLWLIPETLAKTTLPTKQSGDAINIEVDVLAKYIERLIERKEAK